MAADELLQPLGKGKPGRHPRRRLPGRADPLAVAVTGTALGRIAFVKDPFDGPVAVAAIEKAEPKPGSEEAPTGLRRRLAADPDPVVAREHGHEIMRHTARSKALGNRGAERLPVGAAMPRAGS